MIVYSAAELGMAQRGKAGLLAVISFYTISLYGNNRTALPLFTLCVYL
jgi:hypothetical protein